MDDHEFSQLIKKYQQGDISEREKILLDEWFESMGKEEAKNTWTTTDKQRVMHNILGRIKAGEEEVFVKSKVMRSRFRAVYRVAAAIVVLLVASYLIWQQRNVEPAGPRTLQTVSMGNINKLILADGSLVWLKGNSKLTYPSDFSGDVRKVSLQGEALFEVAKDPKHPFVIQCGELTTTVLGTSFNIKSTEKNIEVVVLTGKVALTSVTDKKGLIVLPNQKAVYNGEQRLFEKTESEAEEKVEAVKDTQYPMDFEDTRMEEIIRRIEGKFNVKVRIVDSKLANCMITANFTDQSLEGTINMISQALGFSYELNGREVVVKGGGCE
jgi:ferric-dicitrate binding protein FerR (iron transport regulator)